MENLDNSSNSYEASVDAFLTNPDKSGLCEIMTASGEISKAIYDVEQGKAEIIH